MSKRKSKYISECDVDFDDSTLDYDDIPDVKYTGKAFKKLKSMEYRGY